MATTNLKDAMKKGAKAPEAEPEKQLATREETPLGPATSGPLAGATDAMGEVTDKHLKFPNINVVQGSTEKALIKEFGMGAILYNREVKIGDEDTDCEIVILRSKLQFQQNLEYESDEMPLIFNSAEEVVAAGGTLRYDPENPKSNKWFKDLLTLQILARRPEDCPDELESLFAYEVNNIAWGMARWYLSGSSFTNMGKVVLAHRTTLLRDGWCNGRYKVHTAEKHNPKNSWHVPVPKFIGRNTAEEVAFFHELMGV